MYEKEEKRERRGKTNFICKIAIITFFIIYLFIFLPMRQT